MKLFIRMLIFGLLFSTVFFVVRHLDIIPMHILLSETDGIGLLYSTVGLFFGIISAFVIQTQWENWDNLLISVHGEIKSLRQLLLFSSHVSPKFHNSIKLSIKIYLEKVIVHWHNNDTTKSHQEVTNAFQNVQEDIYSLWTEKQLIIESANEILLAILNFHDDIVHYSSRRIPIIVRTLIVFNVIFVICLPLFIGVRTLWLDYIITLSIALLAFLVYSVISDLDNPLEPGNWHISSSSYKELLHDLNQRH